MAEAYHDFFGLAVDDSKAKYERLNQIGMLINGVINVVSVLFFSRKRLGKRKIEKLIIYSYILLVISSLINAADIAVTDAISMAIYLAGSFINPSLLLVYMPHITGYDLRCMGFVTGIFFWPKELTNIVMLAFGTSYHEAKSKLFAPQKYDDKAYWVVAVSFPVMALLTGYVFLIGERVRHKKLKTIAQQPPSISSSQASRADDAISSPSLSGIGGASKFSKAD